MVKTDFSLVYLTMVKLIYQPHRLFFQLIITGNWQHNYYEIISLD